MNEKIKELAEQATEVSEWLSGNLCPDAPDLAKFAELIVRECADIALKKGMASPDTDFRTGSILLSEYLLVRFGVEE